MNTTMILQQIKSPQKEAQSFQKKCESNLRKSYFFSMFLDPQNFIQNPSTFLRHSCPFWGMEGSLQNQGTLEKCNKFRHLGLTLVGTGIALNISEAKASIENLLDNQVSNSVSEFEARWQNSQVI